MSLDRTTVIELNAPTGLDIDGLCPLVARVQRLVMSGRKAIVVVSAPTWRSDRDVGASERLGAAADSHARAMLVGSGAVEAADRLAGLLADRGVRVAKPDARKTAPKTRGHPLDAQPRRLSAVLFLRTLERSDVIVVPAGVGVDDHGRATHMGERGGTLTALFIASVLALSVELAGVETDRRETIGGRKARLYARAHGIEFTEPGGVAVTSPRTKESVQSALDGAIGGPLAASA